MSRAVDDVQKGALHPAPLYSHRFPLSGLDEALRLSAARPEGFLKALVLM